MTARHVRVAAALFAAVALHALLLSWSWPAQHQLAFSDARLQVELLQSAASPSGQNMLKPEAEHLHSSEPLQATASPAMSPQHQHVSAVSASPRQPVAPKPASRPEIMPSPPEPAVAHAVAEIKPEHATQNESKADSQARHVFPAHQTHTPATLAAGVQAMLLANIHYPRQARRHGWEGAGEFQLDIDSQSIRNITMLVSTGHAILDRAARRGLTGIDRVPIADGRYRLPVEFRLQ